MKRVGIYSGTFDPVHEGHIAFAQAAVADCGLDKVFLLVEPRPRRKQGVKAFDHRFHMVQLAVANFPKLGAIRLEQARFTLRETLPVLHSRFKDAELVMLIGDDMLDHITQWPDVDTLIDSIYFVIAARTRTPHEVQMTVETLLNTKGLRIRYEIFNTTESEYSSTSIKKAIKNEQYERGLNPKVYDYICENGLYTKTDS